MGACNSNCISTARTAVSNLLNDITKLNRQIDKIDDKDSQHLTDTLQQVMVMIERKKTKPISSDQNTDIK